MHKTSAERKAIWLKQRDDFAQQMFGHSYAVEQYHTLCANLVYKIHECKLHALNRIMGWRNVEADISFREAQHYEFLLIELKGISLEEWSTIPYGMRPMEWLERLYTQPR